VNQHRSTKANAGSLKILKFHLIVLWHFLWAR